MNSSKLSICSFNVQGFDNSWNYVQYLLKTVDIMFIQEHWLLSSNLSHINDLNNDFVGYSKSSMDLKCSNGLFVGRHFGGVAVLWNKSLGNCRFVVTIMMVELFALRCVQPNVNF